ncbi:efflux RND transporter periplasmic adaptor subunit [Crateriforma conspicua]|uniref:Multidrug resistance protein MdtA n=1 Tax=Crateriforma conspicua TaxID=2527996 RepID=A0A5C5YB73_9PLAN|nr:HlyD family efflux transporter periplasmic adaptor subunit [Crateriforma conspicua]TWT72219.1 Multidrug resistance protein MdtA precursor [Crateriforma conspicua]
MIQKIGLLVFRPLIRLLVAASVIMTVGLVALLTAWSLSGGVVLQDVAAEPTADVASLYVDVIRVGSVKPPEQVSRYRGTVQPRRESLLAFRRSGRIDRVDVHEGDTVRRGDELAMLDVSDLKAERDSLQAQLDVAVAKHAEAVAGPRRQTIAAAAAEVDRLRAEVSAAQSRWQREQVLRSRGAGSDQSFDDAKFAVQRLQAALESATAAHEELAEGTRIEQVQQAKANIDIANAMLQRIDVDLKDSRILAPFDGSIALRQVDEGTIVGADQPVFRLIESPPLEARFGLPPETVSTLAVGQTLQTEIDGRRHSATVLRIHPSLDVDTRTQRIDVRFDAADEVLVGQAVTLLIAMSQASGHPSSVRFWVPTTALVRGSRGLWSVFAAVGNPATKFDDPRPPVDRVAGSTKARTRDVQIVPSTIERRDVRVLSTDGPWCEVTGMLHHGDWIVGRGTHRVGPGTRVMAKRKLPLRDPDDSSTKPPKASVSETTVSDDSGREGPAQCDRSTRSVPTSGDDA